MAKLVEMDERALICTQMEENVGDIGSFASPNGTNFLKLAPVIAVFCIIVSNSPYSHSARLYASDKP
jgi:hypothetical protein